MSVLKARVNGQWVEIGGTATPALYDLPVLRLYLASSITVAAATTVCVDWTEHADSDPQGVLSLSTPYRITANRAGYYLVTYIHRWNAIIYPAVASSQMNINSAEAVASGVRQFLGQTITGNDAVGAKLGHSTKVVWLNAGDYLNIFANTSEASSSRVLDAGDAATSCQVTALVAAPGQKGEQGIQGVPGGTAAGAVAQAASGSQLVFALNTNTELFSMAFVPQMGVTYKVVSFIRAIQTIASTGGHARITMTVNGVSIGAYDYYVDLGGQQSGWTSPTTADYLFQPADLVVGVTNTVKIFGTHTTGATRGWWPTLAWIEPVGAGLIGPKGDKGDTGSGSTITVQEEGVEVGGTPRPTLNFIGPRITSVDDVANSRVNITIPPSLLNFTATAGWPTAAWQAGTTYSYGDIAVRFSTYWVWTNYTVPVTGGNGPGTNSSYWTLLGSSPSMTTAERTAWSASLFGNTVYDSTLDTLYVWQGTWVSLNARHGCEIRTTGQSFTTGQTAQITFGLENWDTDAFHAASATQAIIPTGLDGVYSIQAMISSNIAPAALTDLAIMVNSTVHAVSYIPLTKLSVMCADLCALTAGNTVGVQVYNGHNATVTIICYLRVLRVSD